MLSELKNYILQNKLFCPEQSVLLAVSGGMDSMVMAHLFAQSGFSFAVAHCDFSLRGNDSDEDENFVRQIAQQYHVPFYSKKFNTVDFAQKNRIGIQEAARKLRYDWFEELLATEKFDYLATAHHQDDHIETFFINLLRGCGISGLHGILNKRDQIIRPLLFATKKDIETYQKKHQLPYREDSSNREVKYTRNKIRHQLIPVIRELVPNFDAVMADNMKRFYDVEQIYQSRVLQVKEDITTNTCDGGLMIDIEKLQKAEAPQTFLFEILSPFGFKKDIIPAIIDSLNAQAGKQFFSGKYKLLKDRTYLFLYEQKISDSNEYLIEKDTSEIFYPLHLKISFEKNSERFVFEKNRDISYFDNDKLTFPLTLRKVRKGDKFSPFGMEGEKKISDFFIDNKLSQKEKDDAWILCSGKDIIWVVGYRAGELFRITPATKNIIIINKLTL